MSLSSFCTQGLTSVSVNWGAWAGSGMAAGAGLARMERLGFGAIPPAAGAAALGSVLRSLHGSATAAQLTGSVFLWDRCDAPRPGWFWNACVTLCCGMLGGTCLSAGPV